MKLRGLVLAMLALLIVAVPSQAKTLSYQSHGTLAASATVTGNEILVSGVESPLVITVGYNAVTTGNLTVAVEASLDGTNWAIPSQSPGTITTVMQESLTGPAVAGYFIVPFALTLEALGGNVADATQFQGTFVQRIRVKLTNTSTTQSVTSLVVGVYAN